MSNTYTWSFPALEAYPQSEGQSDVVFTIHYRLDGTDGTHTAGVYSTVAVTYKSGDPFTPYSQLTEQQVQSWVEDTLGAETVAAMKLNIDNQIEDQINPKTVTLPPPWSQPQTV